MTDLLEYTGTLSAAVKHTSGRTGLEWLTITLDADDGKRRVEICPRAYRALKGHLAFDVEVTVTVREPGAFASSVAVAGHQWHEPTEEDEEDAHRAVEAYLGSFGLKLPAVTS